MLIVMELIKIPKTIFHIKYLQNSKTKNNSLHCRYVISYSAQYCVLSIILS